MLKIDEKDGAVSIVTLGSIHGQAPDLRQVVQRLLRENAELVLRHECGEDVFVLAHDVRSSTATSDTIDALAIDGAGNGIVVDFGRDAVTVGFTRAAAAAHVLRLADWHRDLLPLMNKARQDDLQQFLDRHHLSPSDINRSQRLIMLDGEVDAQTRHAAQWLADGGVAIACYALSIVHDAATHSEYLLASRVFPGPDNPEPRSEQLLSTAPEHMKLQAGPDAILARCTVPHLFNFFAHILEEDRSRILSPQTIGLPCAGPMRFQLTPVGDHADVKQLGRFPGDEDHWEQLSAPALKIFPDSLTFQVWTPADVKRLETFLLQSAHTVWWLTDNLANM